MKSDMLGSALLVRQYVCQPSMGQQLPETWLEKHQQTCASDLVDLTSAFVIFTDANGGGRVLHFSRGGGWPDLQNFWSES